MAARRGRRPTVTEQIAHTELSIRANARDEAEREAVWAEERRGMPDDWECSHGGHYPPHWVENRGRLSKIDPVVLALAALHMLANQAAHLTDAEREFYHSEAERAYNTYARCSDYAEQHISERNKLYAREVNERVAASRAARGVVSP